MPLRRTGHTPAALPRRHARSSVGHSVVTAVEALEGRRLLAAIVVTSTADTATAGTLRTAIDAANKATAATTITFDPVVFATAKTITLGGTQLLLSNTKAATTITGPAAGVTLSGNDKSRVIGILTGVTVGLANLTITKGAAVVAKAPQDRGGGIENFGNLTVRNSTFVSNRAIQNGAAINEDFPGQMTLIDCTFTGNTLSATNSAGGAISAAGTVTLYGCTVSKNTAVNGGGICINNTVNRPFTLSNSIVSGNTASNAASGDAVGNFVSKGFNLVGIVGSSAGWVATDKTGTRATPLSANLGALASNGGPTQTMLPQAGSPAIDKGSNALIPAATTVDQRGYARIANTTVDIGAVEIQGTIAGTVFKDADADGVKDSTETGLSGVVVYVDTNGDGVRQTSEPSATTDASGGYKIYGLAAGTFKVRQVVPTGLSQSLPTGNAVISVTLASGQAATDRNFGDKTATVDPKTASISGTVFNDGDGDATRDAGELGLGLWQAFIDANKNGKLDAGETVATTDADGLFAFTGLAAGTYTVRVVQRANTAVTTSNPLTISLTSGKASTGNLFGEKRIGETA